jgi:hypothetical protein
MTSFRINDNKPSNNINTKVITERKNLPQISQNQFLSDQEKNIQNNTKTKNDSLGSIILTKDNIQRNVRITAVPRSVRNNKFNWFSFEFQRGFPLVLNYNFCKQRLTTVFKSNSRFFSKHYFRFNNQSYGDVQTFISNSDGCFNTETIPPSCIDLSQFITYSVNGTFLNTNNDPVIINGNINVPRFLRFDIVDSECICADGCYIIDFLQEENSRIVQHPEDFILRDSVVELVLGAENYIRIKLYTITLTYIDIKYNLIIDTNTNKLVNYICVSRPNETGFASLIGFCQPADRLPPTISRPPAEPPPNPSPTLLETPTETPTETPEVTPEETPEPEPNECVPSPYSPEDACYQQVILQDPFCCATNWDSVCESIYQSCQDSIGLTESPTESPTETPA